MRPDPAYALTEFAASRPAFGVAGPAHPDLHRAMPEHAVREPAISVEIATPPRFAMLGRAWRDLVARALEPNVFMEPSVVVAAAAAADTAAIHVLLAWAGPGAPGRLLGAWAFICRRPSSGLPFTVLKTPVHEHAGLGTPVLDADRGAEALAAMLDAIATEPGLPKLVEIASLDAGGPVGLLVAEVLAARRGGLAQLEKRLRPQLATTAQAGAAAISGSRAKALRQRSQRLARRGAVTCTVHATKPELAAALDEFLALEAAGWKGKTGRRGRAMAREPALERFFRSAVEGLAVQGLATVTALRCDGRPVAMQVTLRSGATAFTWKSCYDEAAKACAPGIILLQDVTVALLSEPGLRMADSCNHRDDGYMAEFWSGRKPVQDVLLDARGQDTPAFLALACIERARRRFQIQARQLRALVRSRRHDAAAALRSAAAGLAAWRQRLSASAGPAPSAPTELPSGAPQDQPGSAR